MSAPKMEVRVRHNIAFDRGEIYVVQRRAFHDADAYGVMEKGRVVFHRFSKGEDVQPLLSMPSRFMGDFLDGLMRYAIDQPASTKLAYKSALVACAVKAGLPS